MSKVEEERPTRTAAGKARVESFLRDYEWTWTSAVVFSLALVFFLLITTTVMPSFWLYYADQVLKWDGGSPQTVLFWTLDGIWLTQIRDAVTMGLSTMPIVITLVVAAIMQNWRRKLRGAGGTRPTGGYR